MSLSNKLLALLLGLAASISIFSLDALAVDRDKNKFSPPELDTLQTKLTVSGVTIGAVPYDRDSGAFGKLNPYEHGVLPVLVIIRNGGKETIRLDRMKIEYHDRDRRAVSATPAADVPYLEAPSRPTFGGPQIPGITRKKKNPLAAQEIESRALTARMLPPGEMAHGFVYFRTGHRSGSTLYVTGLQEAGSGKELFYFEVPLD